MVFPFLSLYMKKDLEFSANEISLVLFAFGAGSMAGGWIGGKLSDHFGYYPIMLWSLILSGIAFIGIQFIQSFEWLCVGIFILMVIADAFRPAAYVAVATYSKPENRTRSVSLFRLAINLGFAMGPAIGGILIDTIGYNGLFWTDGFTCIMAGLSFFLLLDRRQAKKDAQEIKTNIKKSPYFDIIYLLFLLSVLLIAIGFMQLFTIVPLFFDEIHLLSPKYIGYIMASNGILIFIFEMPVVKYYENPRFSIIRILIISTVILSLGFLLFNLTLWTGIVIFSILFITFGEILSFPFANRFALDRSLKGKSGEYMALFTIVFSLGHTIGSPLGMKSVDYFGYETTWYIVFGLIFAGGILFILLGKLMEKELINHK